MHGSDCSTIDTDYETFNIMQIDSLASNHYAVSLTSQTLSHSAAPILSNLPCIIESDQCCGTERVWYARLVHSYGWYYHMQ